MDAHSCRDQAKCAQVIGNIVGCGNSNSKYRKLHISSGRFHDEVWIQPGGRQVGLPSDINKL